MAIKLKYGSRTNVPVELQGLYVEWDGGFYLDVEGAVEKARLDEFRNNNVAIAAATKRGVRPTAIPDLTSRARAVFRLDGNGKPIPYEGDAVRFGQDGVSPMSIDVWADGLVQEAPHLFETSAGSGAASSNSGGGAIGEKNPWAKEHWNLTRQGEVYRKDPGKADMLRRAARK